MDDPRTYKQIAADLRRQIYDGTLKPGDPTPSITTLSQTYGHARPTCAHALHELEAEGLVIRIPGHGYFVSSSTPKMGGSNMKLHISHGAGDEHGNFDWFVVEPLEGQTKKSIIDTDITHDMAIQSLLRAGRSVFEVDIKDMTVSRLEP
jgi:hypothetical protein